MKNNNGSGVVEIIFSIGVIAVVIVGVVTLVVNVMSTKSKSLKRKMAIDLSEIVVENLLQKKKNSFNEFWSLNSIGETSMPGFEGYVYTVGFTEVSGVGCSDGINDCANAVINIMWDGGESSMSVTRFFSRRG